MSKVIKFLHYSDTHGHHQDLFYPSPYDKFDVMIHSGDLCGMGETWEVDEFLRWCEMLLDDKLFKHIIVVPGNHDFPFEDAWKVAGFKKNYNKNIHILMDEWIEIEGLVIYGNHKTPRFGNWAFMYDRHNGHQVWQSMPGSTDIAVTHGPPALILDKCPDYWTGAMHNVGCHALATVIRQVKPLVHCFGHIHESWGWTEIADIHYLNSAIMDGQYRPVNKPIGFDVIICDNGDKEVVIL